MMKVRIGHNTHRYVRQASFVLLFVCLFCFMNSEGIFVDVPSE